MSLVGRLTPIEFETMMLAWESMVALLKLPSKPASVPFGVSVCWMPR